MAEEAEALTLYEAMEKAPNIRAVLVNNRRRWLCMTGRVANRRLRDLGSPVRYDNDVLCAFEYSEERRILW